MLFNILMCTEPRHKCAGEAQRLDFQQMPSSRPLSWCLSVRLIPRLSQSQEGGKKDQNLPLNCSFFPHFLPPFFPPQSLFQHSLQTCDRLQTGWEGRTMCCDPAAQHQAPAPTPRRLWGWKEGGKGGRGGGVGATPSSRPPLHTSPISTPTLNPATSRINRSATPYKRCGGVHASAGGAPPTMIGLLERRGGGGKYRTLKKQTKTK